MTYDSTKKVATHVGKYGDHPVGGAVGAALGAAGAAAATGAAQGAVFGTVAGLPGMAAGVAIGGVVGALAGKAIAQEINPTTEDAYWAEEYTNREYIDENEPYGTYRDAYLHGVYGYGKYEGRSFDEVEQEMSDAWEKEVSASDLSWDKARPATRDAYERLYNRRNNKA
jgi:hypothetical protein